MRANGGVQVRESPALPTRRVRGSKGDSRSRRMVPLAVLSALSLYGMWTLRTAMEQRSADVGEPLLAMQHPDQHTKLRLASATSQAAPTVSTQSDAINPVPSVPVETGVPSSSHVLRADGAAQAAVAAATEPPTKARAPRDEPPSREPRQAEPPRATGLERTTTAAAQGEAASPSDGRSSCDVAQAKARHAQSSAVAADFNGMQSFTLSPSAEGLDRSVLSVSAWVRIDGPATPSEVMSFSQSVPHDPHRGSLVPLGRVHLPMEVWPYHHTTMVMLRAPGDVDAHDRRE